MKKNSFIMYTQYKEYMSMLSSAERGDLIMAILEYAEEGSHTVELTSMATLLFAVIKNQMDMDGEKYSSRCEQNKENGKKGGRPKKQSEEDTDTETDNEAEKNRTVYSKTQKNRTVFSKTEQNPNDNDNENEYDNENDYVNDYDDDTLSDECVRSFAFGEGEGERGTTGKADKKSEEKGFEAFFEEYPRKMTRSVGVYDGKT